MKPLFKPKNPRFSSGPCPKYPGYSLDDLKGAPLGRSHRSSIGKAKLTESIDKTRDILQVPSDHRIGIVPASDTGAFEMAMWTMLGARGIDVLVWESFSKGWAIDITKQLKLPYVRVFESEYGKLPDLTKVNFSNDVVLSGTEQRVASRFQTETGLKMIGMD